jgi:hypothetical protein
MKNMIKYIPLILLAIFIISWSFLYVSLNHHNLLEPVELDSKLWILDPMGSDQNPFKEKITVYALPIEIRDDYVKYELWEKGKKEMTVSITSQSLNSFTRNFNKIDR